MSSPKEAAQLYINALLQHILDHLVELVRRAPDLAKLVILARGTVGQEATFTLTTRDELLNLLEGSTHPNAIYCADGIRSKTGKNVIPCLFWVGKPGEGEALQIVSVVYAPHGVQKGGDA